MPRPRKITPSDLEHKQSGRGRLVWTDSAGLRHEELLPGLYGSQESLAAKARRELELATSPHHIASSTCTINELMLAYIEHAAKHCVDRDGNPTNEQLLVKIVSRNTRAVYGDLPASEFGPLALKAVRQKFIDLGWCRKTVNQQIERLRRIFRWPVAEELVPPSVHAALVAVPGLRRGRTSARDTEPVKPVEAAVVDATLSFLGRHVRTMVELQRVTEMRPGEVCQMRLADIDRTGAPWVYLRGLGNVDRQLARDVAQHEAEMRDLGRHDFVNSLKHAVGKHDGPR